MSKSEFPYTYFTVLPHAFSKVSSKVNVSNSFKTLPNSESDVFFLWFKIVKKLW